MELEFLEQLAIAVGLGLLVGLERERAQSAVAGIRTFPLIAAFGVIAAVLSLRFGGWVMAAALAGVVALLVVGNLIRLRAGESDAGMTTEAAALVMFGVGGALVLGYTVPAVVVAGGVALLLHWKNPLHGLVRRLGADEFRAIMRLALIALVILPVLPDRAYGPYAVLNPFQIWLMVVLIVGISMAAYVAYRLLGATSGTLAAGALGGLISSTAATVSYARRTREAERMSAAAAVMIMVASTVAFVRVFGEVAIVAPRTLPVVAPPLLATLLILGVVSAVGYASARGRLATPAELGPPSDMRAAIAFGALYAAVLFAVAVAREHFGSRGLYIVAALSGLTDVDAITLSTARLLEADRLEAAEGWRVILIGALANLVFKGAAVAVLGHPRLFARIATMFGVSIAGGVAVLLLWPG